MNGARVGITAARRADEQAALVRALGGVPVHGPSVDIDVPATDDLMRETLREVLTAPVDVAVFLTGVGARHLFGAAARTGMSESLMAVLRATRVIVRGTKPRRVLREFEVPIEQTASPAESRVIRDALLAEGVAGRRILVQCAGAAPDPMIDSLRGAGAVVVAAHPYAIDTPPDAGGALRLAGEAADGRLDALTFTSAHAVHGFVGLAERAGVDVDAIGSHGTLIVAVGPVTRDALLGFGLPVHVEPEVPRMGAMFRDLATALASTNRARSPADS